MTKPSFYPLPLFEQHEEHKDSNNGQRVVVGGTEVNPPQRYEYMVSLQHEYWGHVCGASLIDKEFLLSAAHCAGAATHVEIGRHNLFSDDGLETERIEIDYEIVHPEYNEYTLQNDVMLLKLKKDVSNTFTPVTLDNDDGEETYGVGADVVLMGWGTTSEGGKTSDDLLEATVDIVSNSDCNLAYNGAVIDDMMCAAREGKDSCQGDSGGPLIIKGSDAASDIQVGIVSWGNGCADPDFPGVYTRISSYYDWIMLNKNTFAPTTSTEPTFAPTPCPSNKSDVIVVQVYTDEFPGETYWKLEIEGQLVEEVQVGEYTEKNFLYTHYICAPPISTNNICVMFYIFDYYGDGTCCSHGNGYYQVFRDLDDEDIMILFQGEGEFTYSQIEMYGNCAFGETILQFDDDSDCCYGKSTNISTNLYNVLKKIYLL